MRLIGLVWRTVKRAFLAGVLVTLPLGVTLWTIDTLWGWIDQPLRRLFIDPHYQINGMSIFQAKVDPVLKDSAEVLALLQNQLFMEVQQNQELQKGFIAWAARQLYKTGVDWLPLADIPGLGLFVVLLFVILIGILARSFLGSRIVRIGEWIVEKIPIVRTIYVGIKQLFETIFASDEARFQDVVLVEYPRRGIYCIGFVTGRTTGEVQVVTQEETVNIFIPTTPNPTSGFLLMVPKNDLVYMKMSVEEAVKMVISGGIVTPEFAQEARAAIAVSPVQSPPAPEALPPGA